MRKMMMRMAMTRRKKNHSSWGTGCSPRSMWSMKEEWQWGPSTEMNQST